MGPFVWEAYQQGKINNANRAASDANTKVDFYKVKMEELERRVNKLALASQAQWELLKENTELQDSDILLRMEEIDNRDGNTDGKISKKPIPCPKCGRMVNTANPKCMYCGTVADTQHIVG